MAWQNKMLCNTTQCLKKKTDTTDNVSANSTAVKVRTTVDKYADQEWTFHAEK